MRYRRKQLPRAVLPRNCCSLEVPFSLQQGSRSIARAVVVPFIWHVLTISWTLYYYVVITTFHKSIKCVHATKVVFDGSDIVLSQLVTCSREIEFIRVECTQTMSKTCIYACMGKKFSASNLTNLKLVAWSCKVRQTYIKSRAWFAKTYYSICVGVVAPTCALWKFLMRYIGEVGPCKTGDGSTEVGIEWGSRKLIEVFTVYGTVDDSIVHQNAHKCSSFWGFKHWATLVCDYDNTCMPHILTCMQQVNGISIYKEYLAELMEWVALRYQHQALLHTCISAQLEGV